MQAKTEVRRTYGRDATLAAAELLTSLDVTKNAEDAVIDQAMEIIRKRLREFGQRLECTEDTARYLKLKLADEPVEHFGALFLDFDLRLIEDWMPFTGTIDHVDAPAREILRRGIELSAAGILVYHNHPTQIAEASDPDKEMTYWLNKACNAVNMPLFDHIIIGGMNHFSFKRHGLL